MAAQGFFRCDLNKRQKIADNGGTRAGTDRRKFQYTVYIPERRSGRDRRKGLDRRDPIIYKKRAEQRFSLYHREPWPIERREVFKE